MTLQQLRCLIPIVFLLFSASAQSSNTNCSEAAFPNLNATGSTPFPGFHPSGSVPGFQNSTWTLHTGLADVSSPPNNISFIRQKWWLTTDPVITTPAAEFPFEGCTFLLSLEAPQSQEAPAAGPNTCGNIFNDACQKAIIDMINTNITISGNTTDTDLCGNLLNYFSVPNECEGISVGTVNANQPFGNPEFSPYDCNTNNTNIFNGSAKEGDLIEIGDYGDLPIPYSNYTYYDYWTKQVMPVIITMWPKNSTTAWEADTRIFCITADDILPGSRVPPPSSSPPSSAASVLPFWSFLHALGVALMVALALS